MEGWRLRKERTITVSYEEIRNAVAAAALKHGLTKPFGVPGKCTAKEVYDLCGSVVDELKQLAAAAKESIISTEEILDKRQEKC